MVNNGELLKHLSVSCWLSVCCSFISTFFYYCLIFVGGLVGRHLWQAGVHPSFIWSSLTELFFVYIGSSYEVDWWTCKYSYSDHRSSCLGGSQCLKAPAWLVEGEPIVSISGDILLQSVLPVGILFIADLSHPPVSTGLNVALNCFHLPVLGWAFPATLS